MGRRGRGRVEGLGEGEGAALETVRGVVSVWRLKSCGDSSAVRWPYKRNCASILIFLVHFHNRLQSFGGRAPSVRVGGRGGGARRGGGGGERGGVLTPSEGEPLALGLVVSARA